MPDATVLPTLFSSRNDRDYEITITIALNPVAVIVVVSRFVTRSRNRWTRLGGLPRPTPFAPRLVSPEEIVLATIRTAVDLISLAFLRPRAEFTAGLVSAAKRPSFSFLRVSSIFYIPDPSAANCGFCAASRSTEGGSVPILSLHARCSDKGVRGPLALITKLHPARGEFRSSRVSRVFRHCSSR